MEKKFTYYRIRVTAGKHTEDNCFPDLDLNDVFSTAGGAMQYVLVYGYGSGVKDFEIDEVISTPDKVHIVEPPMPSDPVDEVCPHCEAEVRLESVFTIQRCPNCGRYIAPCNLCDHDLCDCLNCPLARLTAKLEKIYDKETLNDNEDE